MGDMADMYDYGFSWVDRPDPRCHFCGARCSWVNTGRRWALQNRDGTLHDCRRATAGEFEAFDVQPR